MNLALAEHWPAVVSALHILAASQSRWTPCCASDMSLPSSDGSGLRGWRRWSDRSCMSCSASTAFTERPRHSRRGSPQRWRASNRPGGQAGCGRPDAATLRSAFSCRRGHHRTSADTRQSSRPSREGRRRVSRAARCDRRCDHSKIMVVDGVWCLIGSTNWDARSLRLNFE